MKLAQFRTAATPAAVYVSKPFVVLSKEDVVLFAGTAAEVRALDSYFNDARVEVRRHDLDANDNTRLPVTIIASGLQLAVLNLLFDRLNDCRRACPGIGGDVDASNIRFLIENKQWDVSSVAQAAKTLGSLSDGINAARGVGLAAVLRSLKELIEMKEEPMHFSHGDVDRALARADVARRIVEGGAK